MKNNFNVLKITLIGVLAALVFVSSSMRIVIALPFSADSAIHLGNICCLLAGFLLGGVGGGLAAGIGSGLYDLTNPLYITSAPFTFAFKFLMAFICAKIAYSNNKNALNLKYNIAGSLAGGFSYVLLYVSKGFLENILFLKTELATALTISGQKLGLSLINMTIAVVIAVPLSLAIKKAMVMTNIRGLN